ncbi:MAG: metal ABC transporter ATP-binding protein [Candidatus Omnitrophica bacterium]|nr:putative ABC transporter ATP-binding protein [bacterium]NUN98040.1 metal ABC transporter ATP-binding protein [Candidatus Omnitrophota bacterium]
MAGNSGKTIRFPREAKPERGAGAPAPIEVADLTVTYHRKPVLRDINLLIKEGGLTAVIGPNGAGKSTLLKAIMGIIPLASGEVRVFGEPIDRSRGLVGYVPQRGSVDWDFPTNALDVVLMGRYGKLGLFQRPRARDRETALACLEKVGMAPYAGRQISQLSGGQQQRVFLARALAQEAEVYLMDEPLAGVDAATERAVIEILKDLQARGKTVVCVHHDLQTVTSYFDQVVLLNLRLVASGPTESAFTPSNLRATYGGGLTLLSDVLETLERSGS